MKIIKNILTAFFAATVALGVSADLSAQSREFTRGSCMLYTETPDSTGAVTARRFICEYEPEVVDPVTKMWSGKWHLSGNDFSLELNGEKINATSIGNPMHYTGTYTSPQGESTRCEVYLDDRRGVTDEKMMENLLAGKYKKAYVHFWKFGDERYMPQKAYPVEVKFNPVEGFNGGSITISGSPELMSLLSSPTIPYYFDGKKLNTVDPYGNIYENESDSYLWARFDKTIEIPGVGEGSARLAIYF